jgi:predicted small lipoprotein YifL
MFRILLAVLVATLIAGCGLKGPLYFPEDKPAPKKPAKSAPSSTVPQDKVEAQ